jgi:hypothetical protein
MYSFLIDSIFIDNLPLRKFLDKFKFIREGRVAKEYQNYYALLLEEKLLSPISNFLRLANDSIDSGRSANSLFARDN